MVEGIQQELQHQEPTRVYLHVVSQASEKKKCVTVWAATNFKCLVWQEPEMSSEGRIAARDVDVYLHLEVIDKANY